MKLVGLLGQRTKHAWPAGQAVVSPLCLLLLLATQAYPGIVSGPQTLSPFLFSYLTFVGGKGSEQ